MTDDAPLLRQYVEERSEAAFTELVRKHLNLVYFAALRQLGGDAHAAEDVAQSVFILLARKAPALRGHPSVAGWLYSTTHFKVSEAIRSEHRRQIREQEAHVMQEHLSEPGPSVDWERLRPVLDEALMELGEVDRETVLLRFFEGCSFAELAAKLGLTEAAAQKRLGRAVDKLGAVLARREVTSTAAALALALSSQAALAAPTGLATSIPAAAFPSGGPADPSTINWDQAEAQASTMLSAPQIAAFKAEVQLGQISQLQKKFYSQQQAAK